MWLKHGLKHHLLIYVAKTWIKYVHQLHHPRRSAFHSRVMLSADPVTKICRFRCIERAVTRPFYARAGRGKDGPAASIMIQRQKLKVYGKYNLLPATKSQNLISTGKNIKYHEVSKQITNRKMVCLPELVISQLGMPFFTLFQWQYLAIA